MVPATNLTASLLAFLYLYLTWQVISRRRRYKIPYNMSDEHPDLGRAVRAHSNFQQYTPMFLILLFLVETGTQVSWLCYALGLIFILGRVSHAYSHLVAEPKGLAEGARLRVTFRFRFYAMMQTITCFTVLAVMLLLQTIFYYWHY